MDFSGVDAKRSCLLFFIVSVMVWLITITAVFQIRIHETSEETLPEALAKLEAGLDAMDKLEAKINLPGKLTGLEAKINASIDGAGFLIDPCKDEVCGSGLTPFALWGACECRCGASAKTAVKIDLPSAVNRCVNNRTECGTTGHACDKTTHGHKFCLKPDGSTPTVEDLDATCQCYKRHTVAGERSSCDASSTVPFCGNAASDSSADNYVQPGVCGKCQRVATGGGGELVCDKDKDTDCLETTSCGRGKYCCTSGKCVAASYHGRQNC